MAIFSSFRSVRVSFWPFGSKSAWSIVLGSVSIRSITCDSVAFSRFESLPVSVFIAR